MSRYLTQKRKLMQYILFSSKYISNSIEEDDELIESLSKKSVAELKHILEEGVKK